jgi:hypothetical protein
MAKAEIDERKIFIKNFSALFKKKFFFIQQQSSLNSRI